MAESTKKKRGAWFTKKEITTPLQILNKLLDLPDEKQLKYNPLAMSQDEEIRKKKQFDKKDKKIIDKERIESEERQKDYDARQTVSVTKQKDSGAKQKASDATSSDTKDVTSFKFEFKDIDDTNEKLFTNIITQLNEIYNLVTTPKKSEVGEDEVLFNIRGYDPSRPDQQKVEKSTRIFVPKYIPPIEIPPIML